MPSLTECDEMIGHQNRVLDSMQRIKEVIVAQQHALAEQRSYEQTFKPPNDLDDDGLGYDKLDGTGGFAGADPKKRRGVRNPIIAVPFFLFFSDCLIESRTARPLS